MKLVFDPSGRFGGKLNIRVHSLGFRDWEGAERHVAGDWSIVPPPMRRSKCGHPFRSWLFVSFLVSGTVALPLQPADE